VRARAEARRRRAISAAANASRSATVFRNRRPDFVGSRQVDHVIRVPEHNRQPPKRRRDQPARHRHRPGHEILMKLVQRLRGGDDVRPPRGHVLAEQRVREHIETEVGHVAVNVADAPVAPGRQQPRHRRFHVLPVALDAALVEGGLQDAALLAPQLAVRRQQTAPERRQRHPQPG